MSGNLSVAAVAQAHAADTEFFVRRGMTKGYQAMSILAPPIYLAFTISRRGHSQISVNRLLRATWVGGTAGIVGGGLFEYLRSAYSNPENVRSRRLVAAYNMDSVRADDHATVGSILLAVLTPALFWKRGNVFNLVVGGAGIGSAVGLLTHYGRSLFGDPPLQPPLPGGEAQT